MSTMMTNSSTANKAPEVESPTAPGRLNLELRQIPGEHQRRSERSQAGKEHFHPQHHIDQRRVRAQTGKAAAIVSAGRSGRIQQLGKTEGSRSSHRCPRWRGSSQAPMRQAGWQAPAPPR